MFLPMTFHPPSPHSTVIQRSPVLLRGDDAVSPWLPPPTFHLSPVLRHLLALDITATHPVVTAVQTVSASLMPDV